MCMQFDLPSRHAEVRLSHNSRVLEKSCQLLYDRHLKEELLKHESCRAAVPDNKLLNFHAANRAQVMMMLRRIGHCSRCVSIAVNNHVSTRALLSVASTRICFKIQT